MIFRVEFDTYLVLRWDIVSFKFKSENVFLEVDIVLFGLVKDEALNCPVDDEIDKQIENKLHQSDFFHLDKVHTNAIGLIDNFSNRQNSTFPVFFGLSEIIAIFFFSATKVLLYFMRPKTTIITIVASSGSSFTSTSARMSRFDEEKVGLRQILFPLQVWATL